MQKIEDARHPFTTKEAYQAGWTKDSIKWSVSQGWIQSIGRGIYVPGPAEATLLERALGTALLAGAASDELAGVLYKLDGVKVHEMSLVATGTGSARSGVRRRQLNAADVTETKGYVCTTPLKTLLDLATSLDAIRWEQALECALHNRLVTIAELQKSLEKRRIGNTIIRRILEHRPPDTPPCESILETMMVQLIRTNSEIPTPTRQVRVFDERNEPIARVDLAWPEHGVFLELDGQHHEGQPVYDANRQTAVVIATGWLPGRFTWREVKYNPTPTLRRLVRLFEASANRSLTYKLGA